MSLSNSDTQAHDHAAWLHRQYSPWCLLHLLLRNHKELFTTALLEELLAPFTPSPSKHSTGTLAASAFPSSSSSSAVTSPFDLSPPSHPSPHSSHFIRTQSPDRTQDQRSPHPISAQRPAAALSRYLVQRLHFGYYGNRTVLSEAAVRYLTARARLEYGYFVVRGRAFWQVTPEDLNEEQLHPDTDLDGGGAGAREVSGRDDNPGARTGGSQDHPSRRHRTHHHSSSRQSGQQGQAGDDNDMGGNKDEDPSTLAHSDAATTIGRQRGGAGVDAKAKTGLPSEAEQRERVVKGNQRCEEREEQLLMTEATRYLTRQCHALLADLLLDLKKPPATTTHPHALDEALATGSFSEPTSERQAAAKYWRRVALTTLIDFEGEIDQDDLAWIPPSPFLNRRVDCSWMELLQHTPTNLLKLKDPKMHTQLHGGMRMVQDDARLFQTASGIFDGLATYPKKWRRPAHNIIDGPLTFAPDIVRDLIVEYGYMPLPGDDADRKTDYNGGDRPTMNDPERFPSDGSHVINRRGLKGQGTSIWYFYNLQRIEVMVGFFIHRIPLALEWLYQRGFELLPESGPHLLGLSRPLLLQCCIPGCHAMVRHIYQLSNTSPVMPAAAVIRTINLELLGYGKPKRIEFQQSDFAHVLKHVAAIHLEDTLTILTGLGMENEVVQNRLSELLQIPGGLSPVDVDVDVLTVLFHRCNVGIKSPSAFDSRQPNTDVVNLALQQSFEVQMESSGLLDREWRFVFEETILNLREAQLIVHHRVSDWILATLDPSQSAFRVCFDHVLLEALSSIADWNTAQVRRLHKWVKIQEREARMKSIRTGRQWEELRKRLLVVRDEDTDGEDVAMQSIEGSGLIGLDIEWTTNDQITVSPSGIVAGLPKGSEMVRISEDNHLLLDNGCLAQGLLLCSPLPDDDNTLDTNIHVNKFLRKGAIVQERHWIWLALGLVSVSFQGSRVVEVPQSEVTKAGGERSIPVKMACSPEAYQLVWLLTLVFVRQPLLSEGGMAVFESSAVAGATGDVTISHGHGHDQGQGEELLSSASAHPSTAGSMAGSGSPPLSPIPLSSSGGRIRALQRHLYRRLGADAWLLIDILTEIESEVEEQIAYEGQVESGAQLGVEP